VAYRSRSRPSSTLGAKASTVCPYYLDGDLAQRGLVASCAPCGTRRGASVTEGPVIPVEPASRGELVSAAAYRWRLTWLLCSFQGPWRGVNAGRSPRALRSRHLLTRPRGYRRAPVSQNSTACWHRLRPSPRRSASSNGARATAAIQPGSVDMLGPIRLDIAGLGPVLGTGGSATARGRPRTDPGSGHR
jgi:hypothetical protein